ncbi:MAG TPA: Smr/MutS family protein [Vicinamibacterales bacterium]|nr:Smr/MutS family protein [Vicinamibacterales bacterium]
MQHAGVLRFLEFERVLEAVRSLTRTPLGAARIEALRPDTDRDVVVRQLAATTEGVRFMDVHGLLPLGAPADLPTLLEALAVPGQALEPLFLLGLADFLESIEASRAAVARAGDDFPMLGALVSRAASFRPETADVRRKIDPSGAVRDDASPALKSVRERLRRERAHLRTTLETFLRGRETGRYLQDQVITDRNGRYVLIVKAEHRDAIPGVVHGASTSGASLFVEPLGTVDINNAIVALGEREAEEVHRILLGLSDAFRSRLDDLEPTVEVGAELDVIQAKARFATAIGGTAPSIVEAGLELRGARHPLLMPAVLSLLDQPPARRRDDPVPVDVVIAPPANVLVITGPNTGGKTVALKTAGLLTVMAQAGLHVPAADGCRLPVFRSLFADIGDEQSIEANLSTFSWHVTNIAAMDRDLVLPALVLLDEVGAGTDPIEGGALGMAIIDHFRRRGATVIATTHYDALKSYAATTGGVACAAFGFDPDTFAPTYQLQYGSPGRSLALEMAGRLGLSAAIVEAARANLTGRETQLAEHLARVDEQLRAIDREGAAVARREAAVEQSDARLRLREDALRQREESVRRRLNEQLEEQLRAARREIDAVIDDLKRRTSTLVRDASRRTAPALVSTGETGAIRADAVKAIDGVVGRLKEAAPAEATASTGPAVPPAPGDRVAVGRLGLEGTLVTVRAGMADVDLHGKRLRAPIGDLRRLAAGPAARDRVRVNVALQPRETMPTELNVIGCTVDEAIARTEKFLDDALLGEQRTVRVIHGHGTGQLRKALAGYLRQHPLVVRAATAPPDAGGGAVTIVELKD